MNIIHILLIAGLLFFALQQKKESTRNIILIVTALLAVCMMSKEGFTLSASRNTDNLDGWTYGGTIGPGSITTTDSNTTFTFTWPNDQATAVLDATTAIDPTVVACTIGGVTGNVSKMDPWPATRPTAASEITDYLTCSVADGGTPPPPPPPAAAGTCAAQTITCPAGKTPKALTTTGTTPAECCEAILCAADQNVISNVCTDCTGGLTNGAGDIASEADTACDGTGAGPPPPSPPGTPPPPPSGTPPPPSPPSPPPSPTQVSGTECRAYMANDGLDNCGNWSDWTWGWYTEEGSRSILCNGDGFFGDAYCKN